MPIKTMDRFPADEPYRGVRRKVDVWASPAATDPVPTGRSISDLVLLAGLGGLLLDSFAPWQRACLNLSIRSLFHLNGCISANAWSGSGGGFGIAAGVCAILACMALVLRRFGAMDDATADWLERVLVYVAVGAGAVKWLIVINKLAAVGAWIGVLLLFVVAAVETVRVQRSV